MSISFGSINTGLPKDIVQKLMDAERIPIKKMEERKLKHIAKQQLVNQLTKLVEDLKADVEANSTAKSLREVKVDTDDSIIGVETDKNTVQPGNHQIEVVSLAQKSAATTSGFEDPNESYIGVGYIRYELPSGETKKVYVDPENSSLNGIATVINRDKENGLTATVVNDGTDSDTPWRLSLALDNTGDNNKAEWPYFYFIDGDEELFIEFEREAKDSKIKFNGYELEFPSNKLKSLIPGTVINLKRAKIGEEFSINITEDVNKITDKISQLVDKVNGVLAFIKQQNTMGEYTDTSKTLGGDIILQTLESRVRGTIFKEVQTSIGPRRAGDFGIRFTKSGLLKFDAQKFEKMTSEDYQAISDFLTGTINEDNQKLNGFIDNLSKLVDNSLQFPSGILRSRSNTIKGNIDRIDRRIQQRERFLARKEQNLKNKFARLESTISAIKTQGAGLSALGAGGINPVQQLG